MTKSDFITLLAEKLNKTKTEVDLIYKVLGDVVTDILSKKDSVPLFGLGLIKYKKNAARTCKIITTGELKEIPEKGSASLTLSKQTKELLSKIV